MSQRLNQVQSGLAANATGGAEPLDLNTFTEPKVKMAAEREKTNFSVTEMNHFLAGGKALADELNALMVTLERDPVFNNDDFYDLNKEQQRELVFRRVGRLQEYIMAEGTEQAIPKILSTASLIDPSVTTRIGVHYGLFVNTVRSQGTSQQFQFWVDQGALSLKNFYGCFGMTEMGHGSNVAGLETTATYDEASDEFVVHTPHTAASKWWIGGAAHSATHCAVYARLRVKGNDHGVKVFVVPLRSTVDHTLKPGVTVGDIGKKVGRDGIDNGWIQFSHVRIPRQYMLMKYTKVSDSGTVVSPPLEQLSYGALIGGRVSMAIDSSVFSRRFLTIAIRYAAVRRQFSQVPNAPETAILDYVYHQRRLLPRLAYVYAMSASGHDLFRFHTKVMDTLGGKLSPAETEAAISDLKELFTLSAALKANCTWGAQQIIDECRQSCGGHGYSEYNGFGRGYTDWIVQCTWEGDNNVLCLSAGASLVKSAFAALEGKPVGTAVSYLGNYKKLASARLNGRSLEDPAVLAEAYEAAAARAIITAAKTVHASTKSGAPLAQAMEQASQLRVEAARVHARQFIIKAFLNQINSAAKGSIVAPLKDLALLFALWSVENDAGVFLKSGFFTPEDLDQVTALVNKYCAKVRHVAIGLVDSFGLSDFYINAPMGAYDGDVYKHYFAKVTRQNPSYDVKPPYYESLIKPFFQRQDDPETYPEDCYSEDED